MTCVEFFNLLWLSSEPVVDKYYWVDTISFNHKFIAFHQTNFSIGDDHIMNLVSLSLEALSKRYFYGQYLGL